LTLAVEQAAEAVYMLDPDGVIESVNNAFCAIFGHPRKELIGKNIRSLRGDGISQNKSA
jgi:PAS domain S-box-containing protein